MRKARERDVWDRIYRKEYPHVFAQVDFNMLNNIPVMSFPPSILAICGLNGAGKSTIVSAIKDLVGYTLSEQDKIRVSANHITGIDKEGNQFSNSEEQRLINKAWDENKIHYIDWSISSEAQNYFTQQANLDELIEQYDEYILSDGELEKIEYLVGKHYSSCSMWTIEDGEVENGGTLFPYFRVVSESVTYDSKSMGTGEHFLLCIFWCLRQLQNDSLLILEEPETYISIKSQTRLINHIAEIMSKISIRVIITTHSPYILKNLRNENIRIVSRLGNNVVIKTPQKNDSVESLLGVECGPVGTFFVEDEVAKDILAVFLADKAPYLLKQFAIAIADKGESGITERLKFPYCDQINYSFIGVYDGDQRNVLNPQKIKWRYCFLPGDKSLEVQFKEFLYDNEKLSAFCSRVNKNKDDLITFLSSQEGCDPHDWFHELRKYLGGDGQKLINDFYHCFLRDDPTYDAFLSELLAAVDPT